MSDTHTVEPPTYKCDCENCRLERLEAVIARIEQKLDELRKIVDCL
jgi:hypothetical protein